MAGLYLAMDRLDKAEPLMRRALAIDEQRFGPDDPINARDIVILAQLLMITGRQEQAEPLLLRVLKMLFKYEARSGKAHSDSKLAIKTYIHLLRQRGQSEEQIRVQLNTQAQPFGIFLNY